MLRYLPNILPLSNGHDDQTTISATQGGGFRPPSRTQTASRTLYCTEQEVVSEKKKQLGSLIEGIFRLKPNCSASQVIPEDIMNKKEKGPKTIQLKSLKSEKEQLLSIHIQLCYCLELLKVQTEISLIPLF